MIRVVIDTSVLISGVYSPTGTPAGILELARKGVIQNVTSAFILSELEYVLKNKFRWDKLRIEKIEFLGRVLFRDRDSEGKPFGHLPFTR